MNRSCNKSSKSQMIGVSQSINKWKASITVDGININIGSFNTKLEAAKARDLIAFKFNGEYARLNYPIK